MVRGVMRFLGTACRAPTEFWILNSIFLLSHCVHRWFLAGFPVCGPLAVGGKWSILSWQSGHSAPYRQLRSTGRCPVCDRSIFP